MVFVVIPGLFGFLFWNTYRKDRELSGKGEGYAPPGRLRWTSKPDERA